MVFQSGAFHVAQSLGVPVVATSVGAFPEIIKHGETGLLVPSGDPEALAGAIIQLLQNPGLCQKLRKNGLRDAGDRFSWETVATILVDRYRELVNPGNTGNEHLRTE